jgi:CelD/BcsL family acetyltransferase involved in cellulose biosynthesis
VTTGITSEWVGFKRYREMIAEWPREQVSMYHREPWLKAVAEAFGAEIRAAHTIGEGGQSLAITPFMVKRKGPFCLIGSPLSGLYTEFAGPLFSDVLGDAEQAAVMESQHRLAARGAHYIEWGGKGGRDAGDSWGAGLESWGYAYAARSTVLIDLSPGEDAVWASFQGRARNMVRKAEKAGVVARTTNPTETWVNYYYGMLRATFERQGRAVPHPLSFYRALIGIAELGGARCVAAEIDGRMIAGGIFLMDGARMLYLSGTANADGMKLAGTSLLQWHAMREAITNNVTEYDMGGLGVPSIDKFKLSFGGREIEHHRWIYRSPLFRLVEPVAQWAARKGLIRMGGS